MLLKKLILYGPNWLPYHTLSKLYRHGRYYTETYVMRITSFEWKADQRLRQTWANETHNWKMNLEMSLNLYEDDYLVTSSANILSFNIKNGSTVRSIVQVHMRWIDIYIIYTAIPHLYPTFIPDIYTQEFAILCIPILPIVLTHVYTVPLQYTVQSTVPVHVLAMCALQLFYCFFIFCWGGGPRAPHLDSFPPSPTLAHSTPPLHGWHWNVGRFLSIFTIRYDTVLSPYNLCCTFRLR